MKRRYRILLAPGEDAMERLLDSAREQGFRVQVEGVDRRPDGGFEVLLRLDGSATRHDGLLPRLFAGEGIRRVVRA